MQDFIGVEINIGDLVVGSDSNYTSFTLYEVVGFTPQRVKVRWYGDTYETTKVSRTLLVLTKEQEQMATKSKNIYLENE